MIEAVKAVESERDCRMPAGDGERETGFKATVVLRPGLSTAHYACVGQLFIKTSHIERGLESLIWGLAGLEGEVPLGPIFTSRLNYQRMKELIRDLLRAFDVPQATDLWQQADKHLHEAFEHRNDLAHSVAYRAGGPALLFSTRGAPKGSIYRIKTATVRATEEAIAAADEATRLLKELGRLIDAGGLSRSSSATRG